MSERKKLNWMPMVNKTVGKSVIKIVAECQLNDNSVDKT